MLLKTNDLNLTVKQKIKSLNKNVIQFLFYYFLLFIADFSTGKKKRCKIFSMLFEQLLLF